ncbi:MAG: phage major capsid protein [Rhizobiales bacterium]|nr:phage major capsid protein [Hyphomicrobiales bacterium]NRB15036.1 phage major capsid protein [Hyphomicrobiales bacterium]
MPTQLQDSRNELSTSMHALANAATYTNEDHAKFQDMANELDLIDNQISAQQTSANAEKSQNTIIANHGELHGLSADEVAANVTNHERVFKAWMVDGFENMSSDDRTIMNNLKRVQNAQTSGDDAKGGYSVAPIFDKMLIQKVTELCPMLQVADIMTTANGAEISMTTADDSNNEGEIVGENTQVGAALDFATGQVKISSVIFSSRPVEVSNVLLQDSSINLFDYVTGLLAARIAKTQGKLYTTGVGAGGLPKGIVPSATLGKETAAGVVDTMDFDLFTDLEHSLVRALRTGASYMFNDATLRVLRGIKDGDLRPIWQPSLPDGTPAKIGTYGYEINDEMDDIAATNTPVIFGNFKNYKIRIVEGAEMLRFTDSKYAEKYMTAFLAFQRGFGALVDFEGQSIKRLKMADV